MLTEVIKAVAEMFANFFNWRTSSVDNQSTSEVIDDKRDLEKACNYAESAFEIVEAHSITPTKYKKRLQKLIQKFRRYK